MPKQLELSQQQHCKEVPLCRHYYYYYCPPIHHAQKEESAVMCSKSSCRLNLASSTACELCVFRLCCHYPQPGMVVFGRCAHIIIIIILALAVGVFPLFFSAPRGLRCCCCCRRCGSFSPRARVCCGCGLSSSIVTVILAPSDDHLLLLANA